MATLIEPNPPQAAPPQAPTAPTPTPAPAQSLLPPITGEPSEVLYRVLKGRQHELSEQHESLTDRRQELADQIQSMGPSASRLGLENQLAVLDQQLIQLERDLADVGRQVVSATPASVAEPKTEIIYRGNSDEDMAGAGFLGALIMFALFIPFLIRSHRRRRFVPPDHIAMQPAIGGEKIERMEQAIDAIAVEIERVSENQRFMTRLMTETQLANSIAAVRGSTEVAKVAAEERSHG